MVCVCGMGSSVGAVTLCVCGWGSSWVWRCICNLVAVVLMWGRWVCGSSSSGDWVMVYVVQEVVAGLMVYIFVAAIAVVG